MDSPITPSEALERAKKAVGGAAALARCFSPPITVQAVWKWRQAPSSRVLDIERATGVSRHLLRPDYYPIEQSQAAE